MESGALSSLVPLLLYSCISAACSSPSPSSRHRLNVAVLGSLPSREPGRGQLGPKVLVLFQHSGSYYRLSINSSKELGVMPWICSGFGVRGRGLCFDVSHKVRERTGGEGCREDCWT